MEAGERYGFLIKVENRQRIKRVLRVIDLLSVTTIRNVRTVTDLQRQVCVLRGTGILATTATESGDRGLSEGERDSGRISVSQTHKNTTDLGIIDVVLSRRVN